MNPTAIYSKTGKGVQEAAGRTSNLSRGDRAVLSAVDGKSTIAEINGKFDKFSQAKFFQLIEKMDNDGLVREVSPGIPVAAAKPPPAARTTGRAAAPPPKVQKEEGGEELDFTSFVPSLPKAEADKSKTDPAAQALAGLQRKAEEEALDYKAREQAEAKAKAEAAARAKAEAEAKTKSEAAATAKAESDAKAKAAAEARAKAETDVKAKAEAEAKAHAESEAKSKAVRDAAVKAASEARAKAEAEAKAKIEAEERANKEAEKRTRIEAELNDKLAAEARARRETEEKAQQEAEALRKQLDAERKAREDAERKAREEEERHRKDEEAHKRKAEEEAKRKADEDAKAKEEEAARKRKVEEEAKPKDEEAAKRKAEEERKRKEEEAAKAAPAVDVLSDDLLADLDSFSKRDEEETKAREDAARKAKEDAARKAREAEERERQEQAARVRVAEEERLRREAEERDRREAEERARREQEDQAAREASEAEDRKRKAQEASAWAGRRATEDEDDIEISDDDLDMDEVRHDERALTKAARKVATKRAREDEEEEEDTTAQAPPAPKRVRRRKLVKPLAIAAGVLLLAALGALHVMPLSTADYESAASASLGVPVKVSSARMSLISGVEVKLERITIGSGDQMMRIERARAYPGIGGLFASQKAFSKIELEGAVIPQSMLGQGLLGALKGGAMQVDTVVLKQAKFEGSLTLPALDATLKMSPQGGVAAVTLRGSDGLEATLTPKGGAIAIKGKIEVLTLPFLPRVTLTDVGLTGSATRDGLTLGEWDGRVLDGVVSGTLDMRWGAQWSVSGKLRSKGVNAAIFAPALLSAGKADGEGTFSMSGANPAAFTQSVRVEGSFAISKGVLGSFDLSRGIQTKGKQSSGRTVFAELTGEGVYEGGAVSMRNINIGAGKLNAAGTLEVTPEGELGGRIVADVQSGPRDFAATLNVVGTLKEPRLTAK